MSLIIRPVADQADYASVETLLESYGHEYAKDLGDQTMEVADQLMRRYPLQTMFIATEGQEVVGCVGIRPLKPGICTVKRMYVTKSNRRRGIGQLLLDQALERASELKYVKAVVDTTSSMTGATKLYEANGFEVSNEYGFSPCRNPVYMEKIL